MAYAANGWCFSTLTEAANAVLVARTVTGGNFITQTVVPSGADLEVAGVYVDSSGAYAETITIAIPTCSDVGPLVNTNGLTAVDVVTTAWLVVGVWVAAAGIKMLSRALIR